MPESVQKSGSDYSVVEGASGDRPGHKFAKHTTKKKAEAQRRLLEGIRHGWHPTHGTSHHEMGDEGPMGTSGSSGPLQTYKKHNVKKIKNALRILQNAVHSRSACVCQTHPLGG